MSQNRSLREELFKASERRLCFISEVKRFNLLTVLRPHQQCSECDRRLRVAFDKPSVEVCESEKDLEIFDGLRFGPFSDGANPFRLHRYAVGVDDVPKEFDFFGFEGTLGGFSVELMTP